MLVRYAMPCHAMRYHAGALDRGSLIGADRARPSLHVYMNDMHAGLLVSQCVAQERRVIEPKDRRFNVTTDGVGKGLRLV